MTVDNTPPEVREVLNKPGKYRYTSKYYVWFFEVDELSRVHQLIPGTLERDGILREDGWNPNAFRGTVEALCQR